MHIGVYVGSSFDVYNDNSYALLDEAVEKFEEKHPNVTIKYESGILKEDYSSWLSQKILEGETLDAFMVLDSDFNVLASIGAMEKLDKYISDSLKEDMYASVLKQAKYNGKIYALPYQVSPMLMCVNQDLLEQEGINIPNENWTIQDFYEICEKVTKDLDGDGDIDQYGCYDFDWKDVLDCYGLSLFSKDGLSSNMNDHVKEALQMAEKLNHLNGNTNVTSEDFDSGKVAFCPMSFAEYRTYQPYPYRISNYMNFSWKCLTMPGTNVNKDSTSVTCSMMAISPKGSNKDLAYEFISILAGDDHLQHDVVSDSKGMSVLQSVVTCSDTEMKLKEEELAINTEQLDYILEHLIIRPRFKQYEQAKEHAAYLIEESINKNTLEKDFVNIKESIEALLK